MAKAGVDGRGDVGEAVLEVEELHILAAAEAAGHARQVGAAGGALERRRRIVVVESGLALRPAAVVEPALLRALRFVFTLAQGRRLCLRAQARVAETRGLVERRRHGVGVHQRLLAEPRHVHGLVVGVIQRVRRLREHVVEVVQAADLLQDVVHSSGLRGPRHDVAVGFLGVVMQRGWRVMEILAHAVVARHLLRASACLAVGASPLVCDGWIRRIVHHRRQRRPCILELIPHGLVHTRI